MEPVLGQAGACPPELSQGCTELWGVGWEGAGLMRGQRGALSLPPGKEGKFWCTPDPPPPAPCSGGRGKLQAGGSSVDRVGVGWTVSTRELIPAGAGSSLPGAEGIDQSDPSFLRGPRLRLPCPVPQAGASL